MKGFVIKMCSIFLHTILVLAMVVGMILTLLLGFEALIGAFV